MPINRSRLSLTYIIVIILLLLLISVSSTISSRNMETQSATIVNDAIPIINTANNLLTFRDRRLAGEAFWRGLVTFALGCSGGAILGGALGVTAHNLGAPWLLAGALGAVSSALMNYFAGTALTWRRGRATAERPLREPSMREPSVPEPRRASRPF